MALQEFDLSAFFKTKAQATHFGSRLTALSEQMYRVDFSFEKTLLDLFGMQTADRLTALFRDNNINPESKAALKDFLLKLQEYIAHLPVLTVTLAFEPKEQTLKVLSDWFLINMKKQVLFEVLVDPSIIAGASITYRGKYLDFSLKEKVHELLEKTIATTRTTSAPQTQQPVAPSQQNHAQPTHAPIQAVQQ